MASLEKKIIDDLNKIGVRIIRFIQQLMAAKGKNATSATVKTLRQATEIDTNFVFNLDVFGSIVFRYINDGRPPRSKLPPQGSLINSGWMAARGIPNSAEFVVRRSIAIKGIEPYPIIDLTVERINKELIGKAADDLLDGVSSNLSEAFREGFNFPVIQL